MKRLAGGLDQSDDDRNEKGSDSIVKVESPEFADELDVTDGETKVVKDDSKLFG